MQKREYSFDILRVISMIMVVFIHVSNVYSRSFDVISNSSFLISLVFNTVVRISVPIFFMISGALLLERKFDLKKYRKRVIKYLILIILWDIIYLVWEYFYLGVTYDKLYLLLFSPYRAHLWFLYKIFLIYALQPLIHKILSKLNSTFKWMLFALWIIFSIASIYNNTIAQYFSIFSYIGYFILGNYIYKFVKGKNFKKYNILFIFIILICFTSSILLNYFMSMHYNKFFNLYFAYRTPFIMIPSFIIYTLIITNCKKANNIILKLSDLSLGVYLIHGIFLDVTTKNFKYELINPLIGIPLFVLWIFIVSVLSVYLLRKIKIFKEIL